MLYPPKKLPDAVCALLAKDLNAQASGDAAAATQLSNGVAALNKAAGGRFDKARDKKKLEVVKGMEATPFIGTVRGQCITSLYDNDMSFAVFGHPGSALEPCNYIARRGSRT